MPFTRSQVGFITALVVVCILVVIGIAAFVAGGMIKSQMATATGSYGPVEPPLGIVPSPSAYYDEKRDLSAPEAASDSATLSNLEQQNAPAPDGSQTQDRLIIKTITTGIVVDSVVGAIASLSDYAEKEGGFVTYSTVNEYNGLPTGQITLRLPVEKLSQAEETLRSIGVIESFTEDGQDVTEEFIDLDARLRNLKATEMQFLAIMKNAVKIEDVLAVQRELIQVRTEIDVITGRMKYLKESAQLATITVLLSTDPAGLEVISPKDEWKPVAVIKQAAKGLITFAKGIGNVIIWIGVFAPVWIVLGLIGWFIIRRFKRNTT